MHTLIIFGAKYLIYILIALAILSFFMIDRSRRRELLIFAAVMLPAAYILAKILSLLYYDPRPFVVGNFVPLIQHAADNGFPSDHMLFASAIAAIIFRFEKKWGILLFALACIVGISRIMAGVHHSVDIIGSAAIAIFVFYVADRWIMPMFKNKA